MASASKPQRGGAAISAAEKKEAAEFSRRVSRETDLLLRWGREGRFVKGPPAIGMEVEGCLVDDNFCAAPLNEKFLKLLRDPHATMELAQFNVEFNPPPQLLAGGVFSDMRQMLYDVFARAANVAEYLDVRLLLAGILPTLTPADMGGRMMSDSPRYRAFARRFAAWQKGSMARVEIPENEGLVIGVNSVLIESATTSQQIHLQIPETGSAAYYNAAQLVAAPMVALCANSPFFMGRDLWAETRVPLFEQVLRPRFAAKRGAAKDDFFGTAYVKKSALEIFAHNRDRLVPLLPQLFDAPDKAMKHLALHNGTIWRWNRPVISFAKNGRPTLRIEFRSPPSGPSVPDMSAQAAFLAGIVFGLARGELAGAKGEGAQVQKRLPFAQARRNFYNCARDGLDAQIVWLDGRRGTAAELISQTLLPLARRALARLNIEQEQAERELRVIARRVATGQNGAAWQRAHMRRTGGGSPGIAKLAAAYYRRQNQNRPVHEWGV